ncbi:MAG: endolytic transglycosylase MltG [Bdellovibrionales bacterium]|nr:endolytic transglycosylase MltG [Bdellovibrionales bacterium]
MSTAKNFLLLFTLVVVGSAGLVWYRFALAPVSSENTEFILDVPPGSNFSSIRKQFADHGVGIDRFALRIWTRVHDANKRLRTGEYVLHMNWTRRHMLDEILSGSPLLHRLTVKEGHNIWDIETEVQRIWGEKGLLEWRTAISDNRALARMGVPAVLPAGVKHTLEGFLFPETYSYQKYDSPKQIVEAMLEQFEKRALPILKMHPWGGTPEGRYRLLTLASIVEKESGNPQEQPIVASVFWNRLKKKMKLQSDPTTIYALFPDFDGNLRKIHLTSATPYNTYTLPELPAGPISNPGETAIHAVVDPALTDYLYFVARNNGEHVFSKDYKTHAEYVRQYQMKH